MWPQHRRRGRHGRGRGVAGIAVAVLVSGCGGAPLAGSGSGLARRPGHRRGPQGVPGRQIRQHMSVLADDALEGRGLGTAGYEGALAVRRKDGHRLRTHAGRREWRLPAAGAAAQQRRRRERQRHESALGSRHEDPRLRQGLPARGGSHARAGRHRRRAGRVRGLRGQRRRARLRRLRSRRGRDRQGRGLPERCAGDAPEQRARLLLIGGGEGGRGDQARRDRHPQLHVTGRSTLPLGRERRHRQARQLRLGGRAREPQSRAIRRCAGRRPSTIRASRRSLPAPPSPPPRSSRPPPGARRRRSTWRPACRWRRARLTRTSRAPTWWRVSRAATRGSRTNTSSTSPTSITSAAAWR